MELKLAYCVPWIEIEYGWGSRPEGYKIFSDLEKCLEQTKVDSAKAGYEGGYCGPVRDMELFYYEVPYDLIPEKVKNAFDEGKDFWFSENAWNPQMKSEKKFIS